MKGLWTYEETFLSDRSHSQSFSLDQVTSENLFQCVPPELTSVPGAAPALEAKVVLRSLSRVSVFPAESQRASALILIMLNSFWILLTCFIIVTSQEKPCSSKITIYIETNFKGHDNGDVEKK